MKQSKIGPVVRVSLGEQRERRKRSQQCRNVSLLRKRASHERRHRLDVEHGAACEDALSRRSADGQPCAHEIT
jgi:hypothetical protein